MALFGVKHNYLVTLGRMMGGAERRKATPRRYRNRKLGTLRVESRDVVYAPQPHHLLSEAQFDILQRGSPTRRRVLIGTVLLVISTSWPAVLSAPEWPWSIRLLFIAGEAVILLVGLCLAFLVPWEDERKRKALVAEIQAKFEKEAR